MNGNIESVVARNEQKLKEHEKRLDERRAAEIGIFTELNKISDSIGDLKVDFAGWKGRVAVWGTIVVAIVSGVVSFAVKHL